MLSASTDDDRRLRVAPVSTTDVTRTAAGTELHLGSQDLVRLTAFAASHGYAPSSFMVSDAYLVPLPTDEQDEISDELVSLLRRHGEEEVDAALRNEYDGLYIIGVQLIEQISGMRVSIRRRGFVETSIEKEAEALLQAAWQELHLS